MLKQLLVLAAIFALQLMGVSNQPVNAGALDRYFSGDRNSCYQRVYSASHMRAHPEQTVKTISFSHFPKLWGTYGPDGKVQFNEKTRDVYFAIKVSFRGSGEIFTESGMCSRHGAILRCGIECDGGGFELKARKDGRLYLKTGRYGFRVVASNGGCGGEEEGKVRHITRKTDDRVFLLSRLPERSCVAPKWEN